jgi:D-arabinose 1-dehydrogenase-like Zn-dependent alcohol dehydrogenase
MGPHRKPFLETIMYAKVGAAQVTDEDASNDNYEPHPRKHHYVESSASYPIKISVDSSNKEGHCVTISARSTTHKGSTHSGTYVEKYTHRAGYVQFTIKEIEEILKLLIAKKMPIAIPGLSEIKKAQRLLEKAVVEMGAGER